MKKSCFALVLCLVCAFLASCSSSSSGNKEQQMAEEYLRNVMKSPSSFKVIMVEKTKVDGWSTYDTAYHIKKVNLDKNYRHSRVIESMLVDSIVVLRADYPGYTNYLIEYDAMNTYGAILRDRENVRVCNGKCYFENEYFNEFFKQEKLDHYEAYPMMLENNNSGYESYFKEGDWIEAYQLSAYYNYTTRKLDEPLQYEPDDIEAFQEEEMEYIQKTQRNTPLPPPVPVVEEEVLNVVEDDVETEWIYDLEDTVEIAFPVEVEEEEEPEDVIFYVVESMPEFPGGVQAMYKFISDNMIYPEVAKENGIQGRVVCQFIVNKDGSFSDIEVVRSAGDASLDKEAVRIIKSMPKWKPGKQHNQPVRVEYTLPINFKLQ